MLSLRTMVHGLWLRVRGLGFGVRDLEFGGSGLGLIGSRIHKSFDLSVKGPGPRD